jgi:hypothetical protein
MGSVKTNLGHAQEAAGVAGLIKTALALKHRKLPPSLHFHKPNPKLNIENTPFYINDKLQDWPSSGQPLRAGVSSFGIGGTNVHMVLEEAPRTSGSAPLREWHLLTLSARSPSALEELTTRLCQHLEQNADVNLADAAYTCHVGRKAFAYRRTVICSGRDDAITFIENVVSANLLACAAPAEKVCGRVFNIAAGRSLSLLQIYSALQELTGFPRPPLYAPERSGDVRDSLADITRAHEAMGYSPLLGFHDGLAKTVEWYKQELAEQTINSGYLV